MPGGWWASVVSWWVSWWLVGILVGVGGISPPGTYAGQAQGSSVRRLLSRLKQSFQDCFQKAIALYIKYLDSPFGMRHTLTE